MSDGALEWVETVVGGIPGAPGARAIVSVELECGSEAEAGGWLCSSMDAWYMSESSGCVG